MCGVVLVEVGKVPKLDHRSAFETILLETGNATVKNIFVRVKYSGIIYNHKIYA